GDLPFVLLSKASQSLVLFQVVANSQASGDDGVRAISQPVGNRGGAPYGWQNRIIRNHMRRFNTFIGSPIERVEYQRMLLGRGQYLDDYTRPDQWHAAIVRSPVAHGRIRSIDSTAALALPGVRAVVTAKDIGDPVPLIPFRRPNPTIAPYAQPVIAAS